MKERAVVQPQKIVRTINTSGHAGLLQRKCACGEIAGPNGQCEECRKKRLQQQIANRQSQIANESRVPPIVHEVLRSPGQPLDGTTRALMESRFNHDFSHVRVHADNRAAESARSISALAYTVGSDVVFGAGQFAPHSHEGRKLIAHELTHVVQQRSGLQLPGDVGKVGDRYEQRADAVAARVVAGEPVKDLLGTSSGGFKVTDMPRPTLQRQEVKKAKTGVKEAVTAAEVTSIIDRGLAQIDEKLVSGTKKIRLAIRNDAEFTRAWQDYVDRKGRSGASMGGELTGFVDDTHPDGETGFVRASAGIGTAIHEAMHQRASPRFRVGKVGENINEGTTELFTRVVIGYAGGKIERNVYEDQKRAMLRLQGISGLEALAQWYFRGDPSAVEKKPGSRLDQFMYWMDSKELQLDAASRAESAINAL